MHLSNTGRDLPQLTILSYWGMIWIFSAVFSYCFDSTFYKLRSRLSRDLLGKNNGRFWNQWSDWPGVGRVQTPSSWIPNIATLPVPETPSLLLTPQFIFHNSNTDWNNFTSEYFCVTRMIYLNYLFVYSVNNLFCCDLQYKLLICNFFILDT